MNKILIMVAVFVASVLLLAFPIMWLWNGVMPEMFGLSKIGLWMAIKINLLSGTIFKSGSAISKSYKQ